MAKSKSIAVIVAEIIVEGDIPLRAVAIAGEVIALDARISDSPLKGSLADIERVAENYDFLLKNSESMAKAFLETKDKQSLCQNLATIRDMLRDLS